MEQSISNKRSRAEIASDSPISVDDDAAQDSHPSQRRKFEASVAPLQSVREEKTLSDLEEKVDGKEKQLNVGDHGDAEAEQQAAEPKRMETPPKEDAGEKDKQANDEEENEENEDLEDEEGSSEEEDSEGDDSEEEEDTDEEAEEEGEDDSYKKFEYPEPEFYKLPSSVKVHYVQNAQQLGDICKALLTGGAKPSGLGIDTEWRPVPNGYEPGPIQTLQIATEDWSLVIHHPCDYAAQFPDCLKQLLQDGSVPKFGVEMDDDVGKIRRHLGITIKGAICLYKIRDFVGLQNRGLAGLANRLLSINMDKRKHLSCSDWSAPQLTTTQLHYAACDAYVSLKIATAAHLRYNQKMPEVEFKKFISLFQKWQSTGDGGIELSGYGHYGYFSQYSGYIEYDSDYEK